MGAVADAALAAGGEVIGVIPQRLVDRELAHRGLTELHVVETLHERKARMAALSDGFIALPGGLGTLEELAEVASWAQLGLHAKPIGLLDRAGYWDHLLRWLDHAVEEGFLAPAHRALVIEDADLAAFLDPFRVARRARSDRPLGVVERRRYDPGSASASVPWSASGSARGPGPCPGRGTVPPRRPGSSPGRALRSPYRVLFEWTSGYRMTTRVTPSRPTSSTIAASSGRRSTGMSVRTVLPTASSSSGSWKSRLPPRDDLVASATRICCWRAAG